MSELKLTDREWIIFNLSEIFDIKDGYYNKKPPVSKEGKIPFLGATQYNNGITGFYDIDDIKNYNKFGKLCSKDKNKRIFEGDCLVVTNNGSVGHIYFQSSEFTCSHDISPIYLKDRKLTSELAKFLIPLLKKSGESFEYARKWRPTRMRKSKIMLPVNSNKQPDWQFMEDFIKQKEQKQKADLVEYYSQKALDLMLHLGSLKDVRWREFFISDIFTKIQRGKRLTKDDQKDGEMPYVSSTANNNGVNNFIDNSSDVRIFENCLTLANSGSVGSTFFHHYQFVASDHITALQIEKNNKYVYLFLSTLLKRLEEKYSFNREINDKRIQREKIVLPVHSDGKPDWQFMEDFMRQIEKDQIKTILNYYNPLNDNEIMRGRGKTKSE